MIAEFKDVPIRQTGVMYSGMLEQIKKLHQVNPEQAGELAISAIELVLTGGISSDDVMIELMLEPMKVLVQGNQDRYDQKVEASRQKKISEQKLDQIAEMMQGGMKQKMIAEKLGLTQQVVSYRWGVIKRDYPELLGDEFYKNTKKQNFVSCNFCKNEESTKKDGYVF